MPHLRPSGSPDDLDHVVGLFFVLAAIEVIFQQRNSSFAKRFEYPVKAFRVSGQVFYITIGNPDNQPSAGTG